MSEQNKTPEEKKEPAMAKPFDPDLKKAMCWFLAFLLIFCAGNFLGTVTGGTKSAAKDDTAQVTEAPATTAAPAVTETPATTAAPATSQPASNDSAASQPASGDDAATTAADANAGGASTGTYTSTADILKLFNESANKIKTNASKVTRNYEDLQHNEEYLEMPGALQSIGSGLISQFLKKDETPVDYTGADITANYPVKGETFVSNATEADLADATCTDDGTNYNITLKFKECTDPSGNGCAAAFNIIKPDEVYSAASVVQSFSVRYYDATIECKIDKATGNMTWAKYTLPMVMSVTAKVLMTLDAKVGMTFVDDYTIAY